MFSVAFCPARPRWLTFVSSRKSACYTSRCFTQVYLNGKKAGSALSVTHRKAVIPCKPKRSYRVNLVALSADPQYADSPLSNTLLVTTAGEYTEATIGQYT